MIKEHKGFGRQIWMLAKIELKNMFKGSLLGSAWAVLNPIITLLMFWFTFEIGLRASSNISGYPRFDFMLVGFIPWYFMRDMINQGSRCIRQHRQYVTKVSFPVSTIFTFTGLSRFFVHMLLVAIMYLYLMIRGYAPAIYNLQFFYYAPMMFIFFLALTWTTASWTIFSKDLQGLISSIMTGIFWMSGILWDSYAIENTLIRQIMLLNPINYFANGYRRAFLTNTSWFWDYPSETIIFLIELVVIVALGIYNYTRLRKDMADVL